MLCLNLVDAKPFKEYDELVSFLWLKVPEPLKNQGFVVGNTLCQLIVTLHLICHSYSSACNLASGLLKPTPHELALAVH